MGLRPGWERNIIGTILASDNGLADWMMLLESDKQQVGGGVLDPWTAKSGCCFVCEFLTSSH